MKRTIVAIGVVAILVLSLPAFAVVYVKTDGDDGGDGASWGTAKATIQAGINAAAAKVGGDEVWIKTGTYSAGLTLKNGVDLYGGYSGTGSERNTSTYPTIIDAARHIRAIKVSAFATATIDGVEIEYGSSTNGGAVYCSNAILTVNDTIFRGNWARYGGAIYAVTSTLTVEDCVFDENTAALYGGAICFSRSKATITDSTFTQNWAHCGAAFDCDYATDSLFQWNTVSDNSAQYGAGGSCRWKSNVSILNNFFTNNLAQYGAGLYLYFVNLVVADNLFDSNAATSRGGGVYVASYSVVDIINNTMVKNSAHEGGGVCALYKTTGTLANTVLRGNIAAHGGAAYKDAWSALRLYSCCYYQNGLSQFAGGVVADPAFGNFEADPLFEDYAAADYHLQAGPPPSPCVDAGDDSFVDPSWLDLDHNPRQVGQVDIGCYELQ